MTDLTPEAVAALRGRAGVAERLALSREQVLALLDAADELRLRRLATQPLDTPDGDAILVADVFDILDDKNGPDELDRLRVTVQRVRQACHEGTLAECGDDWESGYTQACSDILAIVEADHG